MHDRMYGALSISPLFPTQGQGSGGEGEAVSGINTLVSGEHPSSGSGPWCQAPLPALPHSCLQPTEWVLTLLFLIGPLRTLRSSEPFNFDTFWKVSSAGVLCSLFLETKPVSLGPTGGSLAIGLAKMFAPVFPYHLWENPDQTSWPTQYNDCQQWPLTSCP